MPPQNMTTLPYLTICPTPVPRPPISCYDKVIKVLVGEGKREFEIHRGLLAYHSAYFAAALDKPWIKDKQLLELPGEDVDAFQAFYCFLYRNTLQDPPPDSASAEDRYPTAYLLCRIYVLGDMRSIPALKNAAIDLLHERQSVLRIWFLSSVIDYIYENTMENDPLRRMIVRLTAEGLWRHVDDFKDSVESCGIESIEFVLDVMNRREEVHKKLERGEYVYDFLELHRCQWHDHSGPGGLLRRLRAIQDA